jgi:hypothetical protein
MEKEQNIVDIRKVWEYKGRKCVILWVRNHFCGYVETTLKGVSYSQQFGNCETSPEYNINCHGGLTFAGELDIPEENNIISEKPIPKDTKWYFGMDFAHSNDYIEELQSFHFDLNNQPAHKWTQEEVEKETEILCNSLLEYEKTYELYKKAFDTFQEELKQIKK